MLRLASILFVPSATVLMGVAVVAVLTMEMGTTQPILIAAAAGFLAAIPAAWFAARQILRDQKTA